MRGNNSFGTCMYCKKQVMWIRTKNGRNMPVDPQFINYIRAEETGEVVVGEKCGPSDKPDGHGYISHFATCEKRKRR